MIFKNPSKQYALRACTRRVVIRDTAPIDTLVFCKSSHTRVTTRLDHDQGSKHPLSISSSSGQANVRHWVQHACQFKLSVNARTHIVYVRVYTFIQVGYLISYLLKKYPPISPPTLMGNNFPLDIYQTDIPPGKEQDKRIEGGYMLVATLNIIR